MTIDTAALRTLLAKATPGEWKQLEPRRDGCLPIRNTPSCVNAMTDVVAKPTCEADGALIAALHNNAPALLDAAETLEKVQAMREDLLVMAELAGDPCPAGEACHAITCQAKRSLARLLALLGATR